MAAVLVDRRSRIAWAWSFYIRKLGDSWGQQASAIFHSQRRPRSTARDNARDRYVIVEE